MSDAKQDRILFEFGDASVERACAVSIEAGVARADVGTAGDRVIWRAGCMDVFMSRAFAAELARALARVEDPAAEDAK